MDGPISFTRLPALRAEADQLRADREAEYEDNNQSGRNPGEKWNGKTGSQQRFRQSVTVHTPAEPGRRNWTSRSRRNQRHHCYVAVAADYTRTDFRLAA